MLDTTAGYAVSVIEDDEIALLQPCPSCGATLAPSGVCLEVGACVSADAAAVRGAYGAPSSFRAWTASGSVD